MEKLLAFDREALFTKSKLYIQRALDHETQEEHEEFQLWAALSLELLAKSTLAAVHPALVADLDEASLLAACGVTHVSKGLPKTAPASAVFSRLAHLSKDFTGEEGRWCKIFSDRRNAELHSGELPFASVKKEEWLGKFWRICEVIVLLQDITLDEWLGPSVAERARNDIRQMPLLLVVRQKLEGHKAKFAKDYPLPEEQLAATKLSKTFSVHDCFEQEEIDRTIHFQCPACGCFALLGGYFWEEVEDYDEQGVFVSEVFSTEVLHCRICNLRLEGRDELRAAKVPDDFDVEKEFEFDDYGND